MAVGALYREGEDATPTLGLLRIGYQGAVLQEPVSVVVGSGDGGTIWGTDLLPIDVPLALVIEDPVVVYATPLARHSQLIQLVVAMTPVCGPSDRLYATRTVVLALNQVIALPQWVRGVAALQPASFQFLDRASVALNSVGMIGAHDRPAMAASLVANAAGTFVFYY